MRSPLPGGRLTMAGPSLSMARHRVASLIAVACAVFGGAAMVTATAVVGETGVTSHLAPDRLADAEILVAAPQRHPVAEDPDIPFPERQTLPADLAADLASVPGVAGAAADLTFTARLAGTAIEGHSWDTAALFGAPTPAPGAGEVVLDAETADAAGLHPGDPIALTTAVGTTEFTVSAVADLPGQGLYTDAATALGLAGHGAGQADLIAVDVDGDADTVAADVRSALSGTGFEVVTGDARGDAEILAGGTARSELIELSIALAATIVLLVGFITGGAISVAVAGQRRDLALLRAVGATPRQVRRLVASQATIVAAAGLVPGIGLGYLLAERFTAFLAGSGMMPEGLPVALTPASGLIAAALLLLTVQLAARIAAMRTSRLPATAAVAESRVEPLKSGRVRTVIGLLVIAMAITQALMPLVVPGEAAFASAATATLTAVIGLALAGPALVKIAVRLTTRKSGANTAAPAWLAANNGRAYARRTAGAVAVLALAVGLTVTQVSAQSTFTQTAAAEIAEGAMADATVTGGISAEELAALGNEDGVDAAVGVIHTDVLRLYETAGDEAADPLPALAFSPGIDQVADLDLEAGDLANLTGDTVALDAATARLWGAGVGDRIDLALADGTRVDAEVAATYGRGFGFGTVILAADLVTGHAGPRFYDAALATGDAAAVSAWAAGIPGLTVEAGATVPYTATGMTPDQWLNVMVTLVLCGYVMLGAANSLVAATARRRGEFAGLRAAGATPRQVRAMMRRETVFLCALAIGAGLAVSVLPMTLLSLVFLGEPWPQGPLWVIPAVAALTALIANAAIAIPTRKALRTPLTALAAAAE
ncbi:ABC transporter permease [Glycomyces tritici]|uniref:FtsX-like permease family protein n=1 Tax=Glycomyces tritici TaxID=2665176 RepID=A0ABT7YRA3_9ACTN|nr:ABC transporter permease [Glycomyces tritici]MDN3241154.1 FtsX-like permease family protein [Glycomyces tritici]